MEHCITSLSEPEHAKLPTCGACCKSSSPAEAHSFASHSGRSTRKTEPLEASKSKYYLWSGHLQCACPAYFTISFALGCSQRAKRNRSAPPKGRLQKRSTKFFRCRVSRPPKALVQTNMQHSSKKGCCGSMKTIKVNNCHTLQRHSTKEGSSSSHPCPCNMLKKLFPTNSRRSSCPTTIGPSFDPAKTIRVHWTLVGWVPHHVISKQTCHCAALILGACCKSSSAEAHSFASHSGRSTRKAEPLEASKSKYYLWSGHLQCACPAYFTISFALGCSQRAKRNRSAPPKGRLQKRSKKQLQLWGFSSTKGPGPN